MAEVVNHRIDAFLGLNNALNPSSAKYREGMAYRSKDCRIDEDGLWKARRQLVGCSQPPTLLPAWGGGTHYKNLAVGNVDKIIQGIATDESVDVGSNGVLYGTTGSGAVNYRISGTSSGTVTTYTAPTTCTAGDTDADTQGRQENGVYYYICTYYNVARKRESLPSSVDKFEVTGAANKKACKITFNAASSTQYVRVYRTLRISAAENVYNAPNIFYFVAELKVDETTYHDYRHDDEIRNNEYEGRGTVPPSDIDYIASFNNRMLYFKGNIVYWSSSDRPEEVAQEYSITYADSPSDTVKCKPKLSLGVYGEAKFEITELAGQKVLGAMLKDGKLWLWTASMTGYLKATNRLEGYRFKVFRKGVGIVSDKTLAYTPYGIFGADRQGMWLLDNADRLTRLTEKVIDIYSGTDTTLTQTNITNSFGVWIPILNEYWWSVGNVQIAYQADRGIFVGPYTYAINGGCSFVSEGGAQAYLNGSTLSTTAEDTVAHYLDFWLGQSTPTTIKDALEVEIVHSATPGANVTAKVYQNSIASTTGSTNSGDIAYGTSIGKVCPAGSGRFFKLTLTLPSAGAPVANINYKYNAVGWSKKYGR